MLIMKKAQFNCVDVWDADKDGWEAHTRVQVKKNPTRVFHISGVKLEKIRYVEIAKNLWAA